MKFSPQQPKAFTEIKKMQTEPLNITIRDLIQGYQDESTSGGAVLGYGGRLNIRPAYQREFIYEKDSEKEAVIHSIANRFPLNVMYWADGEGEGNYEILDGQQRTLCICKFCANEFSSNAFSSGEYEFFGDLPQNEQADFLKYPLMVFHCIGEDSDKRNWFKTINIAGKQLTNQEMLNMVYSCPWTTDARRLFSGKNALAVEYGEKYLVADKQILRQDYLEKAIEWMSGGEVERYMSERKKNKDKDAQALWKYFETIFVWVGKVFPDHYNEMKGLNWERLYQTHKDGGFEAHADKFAKRTKILRANEDVKKSGIYPYLLTGDVSHLNVRNFDKKLKQRMYKKQNGICAFTGKGCDKHGKKLKMEEMEADHIKPWREGGHTNEYNCQMLCKQCNRRKGGK